MPEPNNEVEESWARLTRSFVGHVSETLARAQGKGGTAGHSGFERLIRQKPPIVELWQALAGLLLQILKDETVPATGETPQQQETWERILVAAAAAARIGQSPLGPDKDWIRSSHEPHVCHPDTDSPLSYLVCTLRGLGRRPRSDVLLTGKGLDPLVRAAVAHWVDDG